MANSWWAAALRLGVYSLAVCAAVFAAFAVVHRRLAKENPALDAVHLARARNMTIANRWLTIVKAADGMYMDWERTTDKKGALEVELSPRTSLDHILGPTSTWALSSRRMSAPARERALCELRDRILHAKQRNKHCEEFTRMTRAFGEGLRTGEGWGWERVRIKARGGDYATPELDTVDGGTAPHPWCTMADCFSWGRPACSREPLRIFIYDFDPRNTTNMSRWLSRWLHLQVGEDGAPLRPLRIDGVDGVEVTTSPGEACLFVVDAEMNTKRHIDHGRRPWRRLRHWRAVDGIPGRNHMLINPNCLEGCDRTGEREWYGPLGDAMVASLNFGRGLYRPNFDLSVAMTYSKKMSQLVGAYKSFRVDEPQALLYGFRGTAKTGTRWFDARALAYVYAPGRSDVVVDLRFKDRWKGLERPCVNYTARSLAAWSYDQLLLNATYCFAPGGRGPYSFRFLECLAAGSVPVALEDLVVPFQDSTTSRLFWEDCLVRVSMPELRALDQVLLAVAPPRSEAYFERRAACHRIRALLFGMDAAEAAVRRRWRRIFWTEVVHRVRNASVVAPVGTSERALVHAKPVPLQPASRRPRAPATKVRKPTTAAGRPPGGGVPPGNRSSQPAGAPASQPGGRMAGGPGNRTRV